MTQRCLPLTETSEIGDARRTTLRIADQAGFSEVRRGEIAIVVTELATNLIRHAVDGRLFVQRLCSSGAEWLELLAVDRGPGMADVQRCLQDGYSTAGTPGNGFGAIRRLSDEFDVFSTETKGTVVLSRFRIDGECAPSLFAVGATSQPAPNEEACGDIWRVAVHGDDVAVMVADGLGHGSAAAEAAEEAASVFETDPFLDDAAFYQRLHRRLAGTRGAALARAIVHDGQVSYTGVGNISGSLIGPHAGRGLPSQNGIVGAESRRIVTNPSYEWPSRGLLLMHSDGLVSRWTLNAYPGLVLRHPAIIAAVLARDYTRGRDDVTVVAVRAPEGVQ